MRGFIRAACTALYRIGVLTLLLIIAAEIAGSNKYLLAIGQMLYRVIGGPVS
jgi:hypothetical protein